MCKYKTSLMSTGAGTHLMFIWYFCSHPPFSFFRGESVLIVSDPYSTQWCILFDGVRAQMKWKAPHWYNILGSVNKSFSRMHTCVFFFGCQGRVTLTLESKRQAELLKDDSLQHFSGLCFSIFSLSPPRRFLVSGGLIFREERRNINGPY